MRFIGTLIFSFLLVSLSAHAQQFHTKTFTPADGQFISDIRTITQDKNGLLWIGTGAKLYNWDGNHLNNIGLKEGILYSGQWDVASSEDRVFSLSGNHPLQITIIKDGNITQQQLSLFVELESIQTALLLVEGTQSQVAVLTRKGELYIWTNGWRKIKTPVHSKIIDINSYQKSLIAINDAGLLLKLDSSSLDLKPLLIDQQDLMPGSKVYQDNDNTWILNPLSQKLFKVQNGELVFISDLPSFAQSEKIIMASDHQGGIFFSDTHQIWHVSTKLDLQVSQSEGLLASPITSLFLDQEHQLWVGQQSGLTLIPDLSLRYYTQSQNLLSDEVTALLELPDIRIIAGHNRGLSIISKNKIEKFPYPGNSDPENRFTRVLDLAWWKNKVWTASYQKGLQSFDIQTGKYSLHDLPPAQMVVTSLEVSPQNTLWIATGASLYELTEPNGQFTLIENGLPQIRQIKFDSYLGSVIITRQGLKVINEKNGSYWVRSKSDKANNAFNFTRMSDESSWVLTMLGPRLIHDNSFDPEELSKRLNRPSFFLIEDRVGSQWIGTDNGLYAKEDFEDSYFQKQGSFLGKDTFRGAALEAHDGKLWFGSDYGLYVKSQLPIAKTNFTPQIHFIDATANGVKINLKHHVKLAATNNFLAVHYQLVTLKDDMNTRVQYFLKGFDKDWSTPTIVHNDWLRYPNLPAGEYQLMIRVVDNLGHELSSLSSEKLTIAQPFWTSNWFYLAIFLIMVLIVISIQRYILMSRFSGRMERNVEARTIQLKSSQASYERLYQRTMAVLSAISDGVVVTDSDKVVLSVNPAAIKILSATQEELIGNSLDEIISPTKNTRAYQQMMQSPGRGGRSIVSFKPKGLNERRIILDASSFSGGTGGIVWVIRDITEEENVANELRKAEKLEALGMLAGGLAHDFNNLLAVILGNVSLLGFADELTEEHRTYVDEAEKAVIRARDLTQRLLTFSKGGSPVKKLANLAELLRESASFILSGSNCTVDFDLQNSVYNVIVDTGQINQVINNLLINASQAMPDGGRILIRASDRQSAPEPLPDGPYVHIAICDQGKGIPDEIKERIFDPFFTTKDQGNGLGLASAYTIIAKHEGLLTFDSKLGKGTSFHIFLPATPDDLPDTKKPSNVLHTGHGRILIMDDQLSVRKILSSQLQGLGYQTLTAEDGQTAIQLFNEYALLLKPPTLVILDLTVPGAMGGVETLHNLQQQHSNFGAIVSSGYNQDPVMANPKKFGFDDVLPKPYNLDQLSKVIAHNMQRVRRGQTGGTQNV
ncbi:MAG: hybrid sensor histidine kinase/response regulator [bacterium]